MSNKIVPAIYRAVIDEVIAAIRPEFDEYGVGEEVLAELQHKWENKVIASHVAEFEPPPPPPAQQVHNYPPHPMHMMPQHPHYQSHNPYAPPPHPGTHIKSEPMDNRYVLSGAPGMAPYALPPLPGPQLNGLKPGYPGPQQGVLSFPPMPRAAATPNPPRQFLPPGSGPQQQNASSPPVPASSAAAVPRIPQVDGPSSSESESPSPPSSQAYAPRSLHPSLPQPSQPSTSALSQDAEAINSDLDDSDTEAEDEVEEGGVAESDIVFCTYDKVARVKNKWKCILKDGMIHINGKDYLFAKCTGEFEW